MDPVAAAERLAERLLRPGAEQVDIDGVPRTHVDALAEAGLLGLVVPVGYGGLDADEPVQRQVAEILAAADASTWFVWTQHHTPVRTLARSSNAALATSWLPRLARNRLAGVAFTHLRRPGPPPVVAEPAPGGWTVSGELAWLTSWGLADVFCVAAVHGDDVVWFLSPLRDDPGVTARPLPLAVMGGTGTVRVQIKRLFVPDEQVALVEPLARWQEQDTARSADVSAAVLAITAEALRRLRDAASEPDALAAAEDLAGELQELRASRDRFRTPATAADLAERLELRGRAHALALRATAALVVAVAGRAMLLDAPAQRLARTALFLTVQGQTRAVRAATLSALRRSPGSGAPLRRPAAGSR